MRNKFFNILMYTFIQSNNNIYNSIVQKIKTYHNTFIKFNIPQKQLVHTAPSSNIANHFLYAYTRKNKICLFVIIDNVNYYIHNINNFSKCNISPDIHWFDFIKNKDSSISILINNDFLSSQKDGFIHTKPHNKDWEHFFLV